MDDSEYIAIAKRIKAMRELSDISADETAEKLGVSPEEYRSYENGEKDIPMGFLKDFAQYFNIEMTELLSGDQPRLKTFCFVKNGRGIAVERRSQYKYNHLAYNFSNRRAEPFLVTVESKEDEEIHFNSHEGQEFNYCVEGRLLIVINGTEIIMEPGDSLYFDAENKHGMKALDGKPAKFVAIIF